MPKAIERPYFSTRHPQPGRPSLSWRSISMMSPRYTSHHPNHRPLAMPRMIIRNPAIVLI